jgi:hypothetical protein
MKSMVNWRMDLVGQENGSKCKIKRRSEKQNAWVPL